MKVCRWKRKPKGAPTAEVAVEYIANIRKKRGGITPQLLVIEASKSRSPLHDCFEWDDTQAAKEYRDIQARQILRFLIVAEVEDEEENTENFVRAYVAASEITEDEESNVYLTIEEIRSDEDLDRQYKEQLLDELREVKQRIKAYKEFSAVVSAINAVRI